MLHSWCFQGGKQRQLFFSMKMLSRPRLWSILDLSKSFHLHISLKATLEWQPGRSPCLCGDGGDLSDEDLSLSISCGTLKCHVLCLFFLPVSTCRPLDGRVTKAHQHTGNSRTGASEIRTPSSPCEEGVVVGSTLLKIRTRPVDPM